MLATKHTVRASFARDRSSTIERKNNREQRSLLQG